jgi:hypothetical protein
VSATGTYTLTVEERLAAVERKVRKLKRQLRRALEPDGPVIGFRLVQHDDTDDPEIPDELKIDQ